MLENPVAEDGSYEAHSEVPPWLTLPGKCSLPVGKACVEFLCFLRVADTLVRISRVIGDRRRRAHESGSAQRWWPHLNRRLIREELIPLIDDLADLDESCSHLDGAPLDVLRQTLEYLAQETPDRKLPRYRTARGLVDQYLTPLLASLIETIEEEEDPTQLGDPSGGVALVAQIKERPIREWLERDGARLEELLQWLVLGEYYTDEHCDHRKPNLFDRARRRASLRSSPAESVWDEAALEALLVSVGAAREHFTSKLQLRNERAGRPEAVFCELCDELTQRVAHGPQVSLADSGSARFCSRHASGERGLYQRDALNRERFELLRCSVLAEARRDPSYRQRLLDTRSDLYEDLVSHICTCPYCGGHPLMPPCFATSSHLLPKLLAYHANVRKLSYRLAASHNSDARSGLILEAVQRGEIAKDAALAWRLPTDKAAGQHAGLALAWLVHQRLGGAEIALRLGVSQSAVSQRKRGLSGCYDFAPDRCLELRWWPFDDIVGADIARFPSGSLGATWRHSSDEYIQLARVIRSLRRKA